MAKGLSTDKPPTTTMTNLPIIISREYVTRVRKRSFLLVTILFPFLMAAVAVVPMGLAAMQDDTSKTVAVLDRTGRYTAALTLTPPDSVGGIRFVPATHPLDFYRSEEAEAEAEAVLHILADPATHADALRLYSRSELPPTMKPAIRDAIGKQVRRERLAAAGIAGLDSIISAVESGVGIEAVKWDEQGRQQSSTAELTMVVGLFLAMMIYMFVMYYGGLVMTGVMEEKTSRIVEVIVGSVRPFELMMGKLIGVMLVGLTQFAVWVAMAVSLASIIGAAPVVRMIAGGEMEGAAPASVVGVIGSLSAMPWGELLTLFVLMFLGGYLLYASFYAAIGAAVNSQEDSTQFMMPMVLVMVFALYVAMASMEQPDGPLAFWASLFPLTSPIVMMLRLPFSVPLWQEILSVALLYAAAAAMVWASARIYRVGILMYGKKPTFGELWRWLFV